MSQNFADDSIIQIKSLSLSLWLNLIVNKFSINNEQQLEFFDY